MNGYANADTFFAANAFLNIENLFVSAKRVTNAWALRNIFADAQMAGIVGDDIEIENIEFDEILDAVLED